MTRYLAAVRLLLAAALAAPSLAAAQSAPAAWSAWTFAGSLYAWVPTMSNEVGTPVGDITLEKSASDALSDLDFAFMGSLEARRGRWGLIGDLIYTDLSAEQPTPLGLLYSDAKLDTRLTMFSAYAAYRVHDSAALSVDIAGGARVLSMDLDLTLDANRAREDRSMGESVTQIQPLIGIRAIVPMGERWFATAYADYASAGSGDRSWQLFSSVGYRIGDRWSMQLAYRYLEVEQEMGDLDATVDLYGPVIGATYHF